LDLSGHETVYQIKQMIEVNQAVPAKLQRLHLHGHELSENDTLGSFGICFGDPVQLEVLPEWWVEAVKKTATEGTELSPNKGFERETEVDPLISLNPLHIPEDGFHRGEFVNSIGHFASPTAGQTHEVRRAAASPLHDVDMGIAALHMGNAAQSHMPDPASGLNHQSGQAAALPTMDMAMGTAPSHMLNATSSLLKLETCLAGGVTAASNRACVRLGYEHKSEMLGLPLVDALVSAGDKAKVGTALALALTGVPSVDMCALLLNKDGNGVPMVLDVRPKLGAAENCVVGTVLKEAALKLQTGCNGDVTAATKRACDALGYAGEAEMVGLVVHALISAAGKAKIGNAFTLALQGVASDAVFVSLVRKDGKEVPMLLDVTPKVVEVQKPHGVTEDVVGAVLKGSLLGCADLDAAGRTAGRVYRVGLRQADGDLPPGMGDDGTMRFPSVQHRVERIQRESSSATEEGLQNSSATVEIMSEEGYESDSCCCCCLSKKSKKPKASTKLL